MDIFKRRGKLTPQYTTKWSDIPRIECCASSVWDE
ncbi:DUF4113 domain-containing protein [Vibrio navarrensis]